MSASELLRGKGLPEYFHCYILSFPSASLKNGHSETAPATNRPQPVLHRSRREIASESEAGSATVAPVTLERRGGKHRKCQRTQVSQSAVLGRYNASASTHVSGGLGLVVKQIRPPDLPCRTMLSPTYRLGNSQHIHATTIEL